jgi:hypothetical protein
MRGATPRDEQTNPRIRAGASLLLFRDHLVLDLVVRRLRDDLLCHQFVLCPVGPTVDDLLRHGIADARKGHQFLLRGRVEVEQAQYEEILCQAIEMCRPAGESWTTAMRTAPDESILTFELSRGSEARRSFAYQPDTDDADHSVLFRTACQFLRVYRPGSVAVS